MLWWAEAIRGVDKQTPRIHPVNAGAGVRGGAGSGLLAGVTDWSSEQHNTDRLKSERILQRQSKAKGEERVSRRGWIKKQRNGKCHDRWTARETRYAGVHSGSTGHPYLACLAPQAGEKGGLAGGASRPHLDIVLFSGWQARSISGRKSPPYSNCKLTWMPQAGSANPRHGRGSACGSRCPALYSIRAQHEHCGQQGERLEPQPHLDWLVFGCPSAIYADR